MREQILGALKAALEATPAALAFWEQGSVGMGRADAQSDLDLYVIAEDGRVEEVWRAAEAGLQGFSPIKRRWAPHPTWHGNWQAFYQLAAAPPLLLVDLVVFEERAPQKFLEQEVHGLPRVYLDRQGLVRPVRADSAEWAERIRSRLPALEVPAELFHQFVEKEIRRGRMVDALSLYQSVVLTRLIEALRILHSPWRFNFGARYLTHDLPVDLYQQVEHLSFVPAPEALLERKEAALDLLRQTLAAVGQLDLKEHLERARSG